MNWYCNRNGQTSGPYDDQLVRSMVQAGQLQPSDHVVAEGGSNWQTVGAVFGNSYGAAPPPPPVRSFGGGIRCKVCDRGSLKNKKIYRLSGPAVAIGWLFLVPCFFGILFGAFVIVSALAVASPSSAAVDQNVSDRMRQRGVAENIIVLATLDRPISEQQVSGLSGEEGETLTHWRAERNAAQAARTAGVGLGMFAGVVVIMASFVGGLMGWLLTMKKRVLQCTSCQSVVAAC